MQLYILLYITVASYNDARDAGLSTSLRVYLHYGKELLSAYELHELATCWKIPRGVAGIKVGTARQHAHFDAYTRSRSPCYTRTHTHKHTHTHMHMVYPFCTLPPGRFHPGLPGWPFRDQICQIWPFYRLLASKFL